MMFSYPRFIVNGKIVKSRQQNYPIFKNKIQTYYRPKTIQYEKRVKQKESKTSPK